MSLSKPQTALDSILDAVDDYIHQHKVYTDSCPCSSIDSCACKDNNTEYLRFKSAKGYLISLCRCLPADERAQIWDMFLIDKVDEETGKVRTAFAPLRASTLYVTEEVCMIQAEASTINFKWLLDCAMAKIINLHARPVFEITRRRWNQSSEDSDIEPHVGNRIASKPLFRSVGSHNFAGQALLDDAERLSAQWSSDPHTLTRAHAHDLAVRAQEILVPFFVRSGTPALFDRCDWSYRCSSCAVLRNVFEQEFNQTGFENYLKDVLKHLKARHGGPMCANSHYYDKNGQKYLEWGVSGDLADALAYLQVQKKYIGEAVATWVANKLEEFILKLHSEEVRKCLVKEIQSKHKMRGRALYQHLKK